MGVSMSKIMETTGLGALLLRIAGEYRSKGTIYEIPEDAFRAAFDLEASSPGFDFLGTRVALPVGPAAGPHSQIAPNLVAAWLSGARVFELKTVQVMDRLDIEKPCILALDEGHNTEWSTELALEEARGEYLRAWMAIQLLGSLWSSRPRDIAFNISVGYTLEGIKDPRVDAFIEGMRAPSPLPSWREDLALLAAFVESHEFAAAFGPDARKKVTSLLASFPDSPVHSVTLSTMHGCPPAEIESIGRYLIAEKGLDTFVKLNPTLLGHDEARKILDTTGWERVGVKRETFEHDLQFADALTLVRGLESLAKAKGRRFGIKLSNTLANENDGKRLPGAERYMSGRALFPLTSRLAARLAEALPGFSGPFSYCGGVSAQNARELVQAGLGPLTVATDLLKPGGYQRLGDIAKEAVGALADPSRSIRPDPARLKVLADAALSRKEYRGDWKKGEARIQRKLPLFDCFAAPCIEACPVNQKVPEYISLSAEGRNEEALATILADNPLPCVTGTLCDHVCQSACSRNDYEGTVRIRDVKLHVAENANVIATTMPPNASAPKVAVIGAGPAGLAAAWQLAGAGVPTTVFDREAEAGGVVANVVPQFRIPASARRSDIERIESLGVEFRLGTTIDSLEALKAKGYAKFIVCAGAPSARALKLEDAAEGRGPRVVDALEFLAATARSDGEYSGVRDIVVAGGGNTAMDALRRASRIRGVSSVKLSYRRSRADMPAEEEEVGVALSEASAVGDHAPAGAGVAVQASTANYAARALLEWSLPLRLEAGRLVLERQRPGKPDASGRPAPEATGETFSLPCDLLIAAVGEVPDAALLARFGIGVGRDGKPLTVKDATGAPSPAGKISADVYVAGDALRGPASIIQAEADGRAAAIAIMEEAGIAHRETRYAPSKAREAVRARRGALLPSAGAGAGADSFVAIEADRCLSCDSWCGRCVEVCPNRAYIAVPSDPGRGMDQILQVDALCNECGNCGSFCPWEGEPWRDKPALFANAKALAASAKAGFAIETDRSLSWRSGPGTPIETLPFDAWYAYAESREGNDGRMLSLARTVLRDQSWILPAIVAGNKVGAKGAASGAAGAGGSAKKAGVK